MKIEFLMWEKNLNEEKAQCLWYDNIYTVITQIGNDTESGTFDAKEQPTFGSMNSEDYKVSIKLADKLLNKIRQRRKRSV